MPNTPTLTTARLILRRFTLDDADAFLSWMRDETVNRFLPLFPIQTLAEAQTHLQTRYLDTYQAPLGFRYAICLKEDDRPIGYVCVGGPDAYDFGYALARHHWDQGIMAEACRAILPVLQAADLPYITATHDINNPKSGGVMRRLGMTYRYSYLEQWQPKNIPVTFRMYQLNLDGRDHPTYQAYWNQYPIHFVEQNV